MPRISRYPTEGDLYALRSERFILVDKVNIGNDTVSCHYANRDGSPFTHPRKGSLTVLIVWLMRYGELLEEVHP